MSVKLFWRFTFPGWGYKEFENSAAGIEKLIRIALDIPNLVICCEASGGFEQELLEACLKQNPACVYGLPEPGSLLGSFPEHSGQDG